jgi:hypothetical protein
MVKAFSARSINKLHVSVRRDSQTRSNHVGSKVFDRDSDIRIRQIDSQFLLEWQLFFELFRIFANSLVLAGSQHPIGENYRIWTTVDHGLDMSSNISFHGH